MTHCEKCIHYPICKADSPYMPDDFVDFFPHNTDCAQFKPTADVTGVPHGEWAWYPDRMDRQELLCTNCEESAPYNEDGERVMTPYCPHCGAKMNRKDDQQWQQEKIC